MSVCVCVCRYMSVWRFECAIDMCLCVCILYFSVYECVLVCLCVWITMRKIFKRKKNILMVNLIYKTLQWFWHLIKWTLTTWIFITPIYIHNIKFYANIPYIIVYRNIQITALWLLSKVTLLYRQTEGRLYRP